ncbi:MAG: hypothetical protein FJ265_06690 [Planctomycetes bacterium]|nr:hypothetical protein [Planctomycetota bacterium]
MSDRDDWAPLPAEQLAAHPGERVDVPACPAAVQHAPPEPSRAAAPAPPDPEAEQALAALQARLLQAPAGTSLVAAVQRREAKCARRLAASSRAELLAAAPVAASAPPLPVEYAPGLAGRDDREGEPWFLALPEAERLRLREAWGQRREQVAAAAPQQRRVANRRFAAALVVFVAVAVLGTGAWWPATLGAGVLCGIAWRNCAPCRYRDPLVALGCFYAAYLAAWVASRSDSMPPGSFLDVLLLVALGARVGFDGEIRRTGGFDAK